MARLGAVVVVFLAAALAAEGILDPVDFLALQAVRRSLDDMPGSAFFDAWDFTADPCGFPGVYCDGNRYLSLAANRLTGNVDSVLPRLTRLNYLDLSMNQLQGPIPASVFTLPLSVLQLQRNFFSGLLQPTSDVTIPVVDLSYNRFWGPLSPLLAGIGQLYLNNNRFTGDVPSRLVQELVGTGGLQLLYLQHNFLTGIEISPSSSLPSGVSLCLMYNCMVPPVYAPCPIKAGTQNTRPADQCPEWRG
uniref:Leucine-rich repeat-containing N-terminal plant-type domain-containing protein n=1 Tax=Aegilops tauschii TaxID=37682 RepID=M8D2G2_AEGTA